MKQLGNHWRIVETFKWWSTQVATTYINFGLQRLAKVEILHQHQVLKLIHNKIKVTNAIPIYNYKQKEYSESPHLLYHLIWYFLALTKTEIRALEGKLIKYFSKQLAVRASLTQAQWQKISEKISQYPSISQVIIKIDRWINTTVIIC